MIFELDHENITTALKEYMDKRNILGGKEFTFQMKTSRKGSKTSRAIITTVDVVAPVAQIQPVVEAVVAPAAPVTPVASTVAEWPIKSEENEVEVVVVEEQNTPFKKLFA